jgi:hypothetical protein
LDSKLATNLEKDHDINCGLENVKNYGVVDRYEGGSGCNPLGFNRPKMSLILIRFTKFQ